MSSNRPATVLGSVSGCLLLIALAEAAKDGMDLNELGLYCQG